MTGWVIHLADNKIPALTVHVCLALKKALMSCPLLFDIMLLLFSLYDYRAFFFKECFLNELTVWNGQ